MFDHMNVELANQHRKSIIQAAELYKKIHEKESAHAAKRGKNRENLAGRMGNWLDVHVRQRIQHRFRPRMSH